MSELREELDRAFNAIEVGGAPVERVLRNGRRPRTRRRVSVTAGALAVAAIVAGYPALTHGAAAPPAPAASRDPVVTEGIPAGTTRSASGLAAKSGVFAQGAVGGRKWRATVTGTGAVSIVSVGSCSAAAAGKGGGSGCFDLPVLQTSKVSGDDPLALTGTVDGATGVTFGQVAGNVTYFVLTYTDGQRLKLVPVTVGGIRYVAWAAPVSMAVASMVAHLGGPYADSGQTSTAVPFDQPGQPPVFSLWLRPGQPAPPRASGVIATTSAGGQTYSTSAYEGPWGTCFADSTGSSLCTATSRLSTTALLGGWYQQGSFSWATGSAAPGVALVRGTLKDGTAFAVKPVTVGNERLFAVALGPGPATFKWTAYDAAGRPLTSGTYPN